MLYEVGYPTKWQLRLLSGGEFENFKKRSSTEPARQPGSMRHRCLALCGLSRIPSGPGRNWRGGVYIFECQARIRTAYLTDPAPGAAAVNGSNGSEVSSNR
jgi:hypothetical protein